MIEISLLSWKGSKWTYSKYDISSFTVFSFFFCDDTIVHVTKLHL